MRILIDNKLGGGWGRAASFLDHQEITFDADSIYSFLSPMADLSLLDSDSLDSPAIRKAIETKVLANRIALWVHGASGLRALKDFDWSQHLLIPEFRDDEAELASIGLSALWIPPAADITPNDQEPKFWPCWASDVTFVGRYSEGYDKFLAPLCASALSVKIFGYGPFPYAQYLGGVPDWEIADIYASAKVCLDLSHNPKVALAILGAGGSCVTTQHYQNTSLILESIPSAADPTLFQSIVEMMARKPRTSQRHEVLGEHTYTNRLGVICDLIL